MNTKVNFSKSSLLLSSEIIDRVKNFDSSELYWLSGYCNGLAEGRSAEQPNTLSLVEKSHNKQPEVKFKTLVLYASQTGNAQKIAESVFKNLEQKGANAEIINLDDFKIKSLKEVQLVLLVISTHGEGEPPDDAIEFYDLIKSKRAPNLKHLQHSILGLGDSSYEYFCQTGKDFDERFIQLGSKPLLNRVDCDCDYENNVEQWISNINHKIAELNYPHQDSAASSTKVTEQKINPSEKYHKGNPYTATVISNQRITATSSNKQVHHIELSLQDSGITYSPGDSLAVHAKNNTQLINELLALVDLQADSLVTINDQKSDLLTALQNKLEITLINKGFIKAYSQLVETYKPELSNHLLTTINQDYSKYIKKNQIIDIIGLAPIALTAQQLVDLLNPLKPRSYSISSSQAEVDEEVHLTVALKSTTTNNIKRYGAASLHLLETLKEDDTVDVFIENNQRFKLPNNDVPIIMIGPGTGIAPYRAFLQQRYAQSASGKNWLFFGNQHFNSDFLYQLELQKYHQQGLLNHLDVAFSRDQSNKIYVQDRLLENAKELWQWIEHQNACLYICGDMTQMAKSVENTLLNIFSEQGKLSHDDAKQYLTSLRKQQRYQKDVY